MPGLQPTRLVVPIDFSDQSFHALDQAIAMVAPGGSIDVVHVLPSMSANDPALLFGQATDHTRLNVVAEHLEKTLRERGYSTLQSHVLLGDAGSQIADFARNHQAELIVISSHGYGFIKRVLLGSVAERVVRLASCPVLVLRQSPKD